MWAEEWQEAGTARQEAKTWTGQLRWNSHLLGAFCGPHIATRVS